MVFTQEKFAHNLYFEAIPNSCWVFGKTTEFTEHDAYFVTVARLEGKKLFTANKLSGGCLFSYDADLGVKPQEFIDAFCEYLEEEDFADSVYCYERHIHPFLHEYVSMGTAEFTTQIVTGSDVRGGFTFCPAPDSKLRFTVRRFSYGVKSYIVCTEQQEASGIWIEYDKASPIEAERKFRDYLESFGFQATVCVLCV